MEPARELRVLEFTKIREMLSAFCVTPMGAELCQELTPYRDFSEVSRALEETEEATILLAYLGGSPLQWFGDVREQLSLAGKGAALSPKGDQMAVKLAEGGASAATSSRVSVTVTPSGAWKRVPMTRTSSSCSAERLSAAC